MTPPAVSVKIPVVSASRWIAVADLLVVDRVDPAAGAARVLDRVGAVGRVADRQALGDRLRLLRLADVPAFGEGGRDRAAALGLGAVEDRLLALDQAEVDPLLEAAAELGEQRARGDRADDPVGQLPAELLDGLVGERLRALGVVGAQVDVDEGPGPGLGELGAEPVDVVVVAADADQVGPVDAGREQLLLLEVGGDEDVGVEAGGGGVGGDGVGEVAGRGAGDGRRSRAPAPWRRRRRRPGP